jgi:hypothetical protein
MYGEGGVASQSSVFVSAGFSCSASYANDGDTTNDAEMICEGLAWTNQEQDPWWMVNINDLVAITRIVIWNRVTQSMSQLSNAKVTLYDASQNAISEAFLGSTAEVGMIELSIADFTVVTEEPSSQPSEFPSSIPSSMPSSIPSFSSMPSSIPSSMPSRSVSLAYFLSESKQHIVAKRSHVFFAPSLFSHLYPLLPVQVPQHLLQKALRSAAVSQIHAPKITSAITIMEKLVSVKFAQMY